MSDTPATSPGSPVSAPDAVAGVVGALATLDRAACRAEFERNGQLLVVPDLVPEAALEPLVHLAEALAPGANRAYVPGFKKSGSVSRFGLEARAPAFLRLYQDAGLRAFLEGVAGRALHVCPDRDPHGVALYLYTEAGDHIGWHFDTSLYRGARYTLLLGLLDRSRCRLECELHRRDPGRARDLLPVALRPGTLVFFDGDAVWHRVTPLGEGERRICLTMEWVTDPRMSWPSRMISAVKDAVGYFGFGRKGAS